MATELAADLSGIEAVETTPRPRRVPLRRLWSGFWPKLAAAALLLAVWQAVVWSGWKPDYVLPGPGPVFKRLAQDFANVNFDLGIAITLRRALIGYAIAVAIGTSLGILVARIAVLRKAIGSAIFGLQSMPSIAWFPLAILLFGNNETAIFFVVILGAAPAIAGGFVLTTRGGDFDLHIGQDVSIGYTSHTDATVTLYLQETFTFLLLTTEAAVALAPPNAEPAA